MTKFLWILAILGALAGSVLLTVTLFMNSAPQQGAAAAVAVGMGVLPYCLARAWSELTRDNIKKVVNSAPPLARPPTSPPTA